MLVKGKLENREVEVEINFEEAKRIHGEVQHYYNRLDVTTVLEENDVLNYDDKMVSDILDLYEDALSQTGMFCDLAEEVMYKYFENKNSSLRSVKKLKHFSLK